MIKTYLSELIALCIVAGLLSWGAVQLYFLIRRESSADRQETRRVKREAEDALDDLERAVQRATKKPRQRGERK